MDSEVIGPEVSSTEMVSKKSRKTHVICLWFLANIIVWNAVYGLYTAEKDTPLWKTIVTDNLISKLWDKYPLVSKSPQKGMVIGILFNDAESSALINDELVHEGDSIGSIKVVQIDKEKIYFEKNGEMWSQEVRVKKRSPFIAITIISISYNQTIGIDRIGYT